MDTPATSSIQTFAQAARWARAQRLHPRDMGHSFTLHARLHQPEGEPFGLLQHGVVLTPEGSRWRVESWGDGDPRTFDTLDAAVRAAARWVRRIAGQADRRRDAKIPVQAAP